MNKLNYDSDSEFEASLVYKLTLLGKSASSAPGMTRTEYRAELSNRLFESLEEKPERAALVYQLPDWQTPKYQLIGDGLVVGRDPGTGHVLKLAGQELLSRTHFRIQRDGDSFTLHDDGSRNGTFVNSDERRQTEYILKSADFIYAGGVLFNFVADLPELTEPFDAESVDQ
jgi:hypothetical protein